MDALALTTCLLLAVSDPMLTDYASLPADPSLAAFVLIHHEREIPVPDSKAVRFWLRHHAVREELINESYSRNYFRFHGESQCDLRSVRDKVVSMADYPHLADGEHLPTFDSAFAYYTIFGQSLDWLNLQQAMYPRDHWLWQDRINEVTADRELWSHVIRYRRDDYDVSYRRQSLKVLRETLGDSVFLSGRLPTYPTWR